MVLEDGMAGRHAGTALPSRALRALRAPQGDEDFPLRRLPEGARYHGRADNSLGPGRELLDQRASDCRVQPAFAPGNGFDGCDELRRHRVLEEEARGAGPEGRVDRLVDVVGGEHQDGDMLQGAIPAARARFDDPSSSLHAIHSGHPQVHDNHVGAGAPNAFDSGLPVPHLAHHLDVEIRCQQHPDPRAYQRLVVGEEDSNRHG